MLVPVPVSLPRVRRRMSRLREEQIRESAANQSRLEAALKRSEEAKVEKEEEACNAAIKRADGAREEVLSLTAELECERIISRQRAEEMEVMARRLASVPEAAAVSGSSGQGSRGGGVMRRWRVS